MKVLDGLARVPALVKHQPVAAEGHPLSPRHLFGYLEQVPHDGYLAGADVGQRCQMSIGDDQQVNRSLWVDIPDHEDPFVAVNGGPVGWVSGHGAKDAFAGGHIGLLNSLPAVAPAVHR